MLLRPQHAPSRGHRRDRASSRSASWKTRVAPGRRSHGGEPGVEETILQRLVALNAERAAEERRGLVRWLRPEFQNPGGAGTVQAEADLATVTPTAAGPSPAWPKTLPEQIQALRAALAASRVPRVPATWHWDSPEPRAPRSPNSWRPWPASVSCAVSTTVATSRVEHSHPFKFPETCAWEIQSTPGTRSQGLQTAVLAAPAARSATRRQSVGACSHAERGSQSAWPQDGRTVGPHG